MWEIPQGGRKYKEIIGRLFNTPRRFSPGWYTELSAKLVLLLSDRDPHSLKLEDLSGRFFRHLSPNFVRPFERKNLRRYYVGGKQCR